MVYHRSDSGGSSSADIAARRHSESSRGSARDEEERAKSRDDREDAKYSSDYSRGSSKYKEGRYSDGSRTRNGKDDGKYGDSSRHTRDSKYRDEGKYYDRSRDEREGGSRYRDGKDDGRYSESGSRYPDGSRYREGGSRYGGNGEGWHSESSRYRDDSSRYYSGGSSRYREEDDGSGYDHSEKEDSVTDDSGTNVTMSPEQEKLKNVFQNDGSFLEMFKKMQEANKSTSETVEASTSEPGTTEPDLNIKQEEVPKPTVTAVPRRGMAAGIVGKRRGGRVLPTGMVKKQKREEEEEETPKDAWSLYMAEVRKYKEASCEEEGKTRPLVK